jgi:peptidyl-prolyl cis-trans isomerase D
MYALIDKHKKLIMIAFFVLIIPPFALFGIDTYFHGGGRAQSVARVGDYRISQSEFNRALRERQESIQRMMDHRADPELLNSPELRRSVVEALVRRHVLLQAAQRGGLSVSDAQLQAVIGESPMFQSDGRFSLELYQRYLRSQGMTPAMFEETLRQDLVLQQIEDVFAGSGFMPRTVADRMTRLFEQQREVSQYVVAPDRFAAQVKLEPDAARKYYEGNQHEFRLPEQARVEYVVLAADTLLDGIAVEPQEVRKYYEDHRAQYQGREERRASHILIAVEPGAPAEAKEKARALAAELLARLKKEPARFAELAREHSQDPGSAGKGGDLGYFTRGIMVKPFDDAVFGMKPGEIAGPVETQYGYHIVQLADVRGAKGRSFEEARAEIELELRKQRANRRFVEIAETFNNTVFEQSESLKPAAALAKTTVQQSGWITRERAQEERLNHPRLLQAIFAEDVLKNGRNSEVVEVAPGVLVAARLIEHKPSVVQPFDEVEGAIVKKLTSQRAGQLAAQEGRSLLEQLRQGKEVKVAWSKPRLVGRADAAEGLSEPVLRQAFRADTAKLPSFAGTDLPGGAYALIRVTRVVEPEKTSPEQRRQIAQGLREMLAQEELQAYVASLQRKTGVTISREALEAGQPR